MTISKLIIVFFLVFSMSISACSNKKEYIYYNEGLFNEKEINMIFIDGKTVVCPKEVKGTLSISLNDAVLSEDEEYYSLDDIETEKYVYSKKNKEIASSEGEVVYKIIYMDKFRMTLLSIKSGNEYDFLIRNRYKLNME